MGKILYKAPPVHEHDYPNADETTAGTIWQCECDEIFKVVTYLSVANYYHNCWSELGRREKRKFLKNYGAIIS